MFYSVTANDCSVFPLHVDHFKLHMNFLTLLYTLILNKTSIILNFLKTFFKKKKLFKTSAASELMNYRHLSIDLMWTQISGDILILHLKKPSCKETLNKPMQIHQHTGSGFTSPTDKQTYNARGEPETITGPCSWAVGCFASSAPKWRLFRE